MDPGVPQDLFQGIELVGRFIVDLLNAGIDEDLDAVDARGMGYVDGRVYYESPYKIEIFTELTKVVVPVAFYMLGTLVSVIQASVFTILSIIYVAMAVSHEH